MTAGVVDTVFVSPVGDVAGKGLQLRFGVAHGDAEPFFAEHGAVVHAVSENHDVPIGNVEPLLQLHNAPFLMHRFDEHGVGAKPHMGQGVERDVILSFLVQATKIL